MLERSWLVKKLFFSSNFVEAVYRFWVVGAIGGLVFVLDQLTKAWAVKVLGDGDVITVIANFFHLRYGENTGAAFGLLRENPRLLQILTLVVLAWLVWMGRQVDWRPVLRRVAAGLVAGGALGNLTDRIVRGFVVDFLDFQLGNWHYPTFNLADSAICVGVALFFVQEFFRKR